MDRLTRRIALGACSALVAGVALVSGVAVAETSPDQPVAVRAAALDATPTPLMARSYARPEGRRIDTDEDLTQVGHSARSATGEVIEVAGTLVGPDGRTPLAGATIEVIQACALGVRMHPATGQPMQGDRHFQGYARFQTDSQGRFRFRTVRPAAIGERAAHIQFEVTAPNQRGAQTLVTHMYFDGNPANASDPVLSAVTDTRARARAIASPARNTGAGEPTLYYYQLVMSRA